MDRYRLDFLHYHACFHASFLGGRQYDHKEALILGGSLHATPHRAFQRLRLAAKEL